MGVQVFDSTEVLVQLQTAILACDEVLLSRAVDLARELGDTFEFPQDLDRAEETLFELTCVEQSHGQRD